MDARRSLAPGRLSRDPGRQERERGGSGEVFVGNSLDSLFKHELF